MSKLINGIKSFVHSLTTTDHYASYDPSHQRDHEDAAPLVTDSRRSSTSYVPGMRTSQLDGSSQISLNEMAPIPSPELSWSRIDQWIEMNYPELFDQILEGATKNDLDDIQHDLDCVLPNDVRESFMIHDGQERGGMPTGLFFGIILLDLEQISEEWNIWKRASIQVQSSRSAWLKNQQSFPPDCIELVYAHPLWIPLAKDKDGNNIAVDLNPGPKGRVGQVILFGRDFDTKFVVAPSWGDFLAQFAADLESGNSFIDDDIEEAVFAYKSPSGQLVSYFNVLRKRAERAYQPKKSSSVPPVSVSQAPVNQGRVTPRLVSPGGSKLKIETLPDTDLKTEPKKSEPKKKNLTDAKLTEVSPEPKDTKIEQKDAEVKVAEPKSEPKSEPKEPETQTTETTEVKAEPKKDVKDVESKPKEVTTKLEELEIADKPEAEVEAEADADAESPKPKLTESDTETTPETEAPVSQAPKKKNKKKGKK